MSIGAFVVWVPRHSQRRGTWILFLMSGGGEVSAHLSLLPFVGAGHRS